MDFTVRLAGFKDQCVRNRVNSVYVCQQDTVAVMKDGLVSFVIDVLESLAEEKLQPKSLNALKQKNIILTL